MAPSAVGGKDSTAVAYLARPDDRASLVADSNCHVDADAGETLIAAHHGPQTEARWLPHGARPGVDSIENQEGQTVLALCSVLAKRSRWNSLGMDPPGSRPRIRHLLELVQALAGFQNH